MQSSIKELKVIIMKQSEIVRMAANNYLAASFQEFEQDANKWLSMLFAYGKAARAYGKGGSYDLIFTIDEEEYACPPEPQSERHNVRFMCLHFIAHYLESEGE